MKCPVCATTSLESLDPNALPQRLVCGRCGGQWIKAFQYWKWLKAHGENLPEKPPQEGKSLPVSDSTAAKLCPECGHFLRRSKVGHGIDFHVDRCTACGGIWFDKNEWEILESRNLHDDVHFIFSSAWQHGVVKEEQRQDYEKRVEAILGKEAFARVKEFKAWVESHPRHHTIKAFLAGLET
jgi:Zn-finger nucleic acid-binding protein